MSSVMALTTRAPRGGVTYESIDLEEPENFEVKLKPVYTGICGTDRGIVRGSLPFAYNPEGEDRLVLGHESLCRVLEIADNNLGIKKGDYVVPLVRRPGGCVNCSIGRPDNCSDGDKHEAGITGLHGFMREHFYDRIENLVKVSDSNISDIAVLTEPLKNVVKGFEVFDVVSRRAVYAGKDSTLDGKRSVVVGTGTQGYLYAFMSREYGFDTMAVNRHPIEDSNVEMLNSFGVNFVDYSKNEGEVVKGGIDLLIDTSGDPGTVFRFMKYLNYNAVAILFGTNGKAPEAQVDGSFIDYLVERNITVAGVVDAAKTHYETAIRYLRKWKYIHGDALSNMITAKFDPADTGVFTSKPHGEIKSVIKWS